MATTTQYYMLVASLPPLPSLFTSQQTPISRLRLDRRLALLDPADRDELQAIETLMWWDRLPLDMTDAAILDRANRVLPDIRSDLLRDVVSWRLELRTVVAALRRRAAGRPAPAPGERWGHGRWVRHIERHWAAQDFGIGGALPWLATFQRLLDAGDTLAFERELLGTSWRYMTHAAGTHFFSFEAVAMYVLRWDIIARWTGYDHERARTRFAHLVQQGLGPHTDLFGTPQAERNSTVQ
jgi:hypothetical protein